MRVPTVIPMALLAVTVASSAVSPGWRQSFEAGYNDTTGRWAGGSEIKHLATHQGALFAGNGYW